MGNICLSIDMVEKLFHFFLKPVVKKSDTHLGDFMHRNCTVMEQEYLKNAIQTLAFNKS